MVDMSTARAVAIAPHTRNTSAAPHINSGTVPANAFRPFEADKLMAKQAEADERRRQLEEDARLSNLSPARAAADIGNALRGISQDLFGNAPGNRGLDVFTADNRLRGLGLLLIVLSTSMLVVRALLQAA